MAALARYINAPGWSVDNVPIELPVPDELLRLPAPAQGLERNMAPALMAAPQAARTQDRQPTPERTQSPQRIWMALTSYQPSGWRPAMASRNAGWPVRGSSRATLSRYSPGGSAASTYTVPS